MAVYSLFGNTTGLPKTIRGTMPYELDALAPREVWGAGNGTTTLVARQTWDDAPTWIKYMVGEVQVVQASTPGQLALKRHVPEVLQYNLSGDGTDMRVQYCTGVQQLDQGGDSLTAGDNLRQVGTNWPRTDWCRYNVQFESMPFAVRSDAEVAALAAEAGAHAGPRELYRYVIRSQTSYSKEVPIPAATSAGGFKVIVDPDTTPTGRLAIGQVGFRTRSYGEVTYKWVRVPVGWPPPVSWTATDLSNVWPPRVNPSAADPGARKRTRDTFRGTVNNDWFDAGAPEGYSFAPGELLYIGYDDNFKYYDAAGSWVMDIVFKFKWCEGGWNKFLNARGNFVEVSADDAPGTAGTNQGRRPYQSNSFNQLFFYT